MSPSPAVAVKNERRIQPENRFAATKCYRDIKAPGLTPVNGELIVPLHSPRDMIVAARDRQNYFI